MLNPVNWDLRLPDKLIEHCHRCGDFIVSDDKAEITLFMFDHYGREGIRLCTVPDEPIEPIDLSEDFW